MPFRFRLQPPLPSRWIGVATLTGVLGVSIAVGAPVVEDPAPAKPSTSSAVVLSPAESRMREDVTYLAADERDGRGPGTRGIDEAADYISFVFKSAGLKPPP